MFNIIALLFAGCVMTACSDEELVEGGSTVVEENLPVTLDLSVQDVTPTVVESRATDEEEKLLNNLQVFIFDAAGE